MKIDIDGSRDIRKDAFVKAFLFEHEEAFVSELYRAWRRFCAAANRKPGTVAAMRQVVKNMKDDGIIENHRSEAVPNEPHLFPRQYYRLTAFAFEDDL